MSECPRCRDWGTGERHEDHRPPRLLDNIVDPEEPARKPRRRVKRAATGLADPREASRE